MKILYSTLKSKVEVINAINSQASVQDYVEKEFLLKGVLAYSDTNDEGKEVRVSCFYVDDENGKQFCISSISSTVFDGIGAIMAVSTNDDGTVEFEEMHITFHKGRTRNNRDFVYFEVR